MNVYASDLINLDDISLNEETASELVSTTWRRILARTGTQNIRAQYLGVDKDGVLSFKCNSGTVPGKYWKVRIKFKDIDKAKEYLRKSILNRRMNAVKLLIDGDIQIHCTGHAWKYYCQYVAWKNGYGLEKETRRPVVRNPKEDKLICKHTYACVLWMNDKRNLNQLSKDLVRVKVLPNTLDRIFRR